MKESARTGLSAFARDVEEGLSAAPKFLSSKYFYDDEGSRLFREIMKLPEYYLTRTESEIFSEKGAEICSDISNGSPGFDLVELGAGDGQKTAVLVERMLEQGADIRFVPIDISSEAIDAITAKFRKRFPALQVVPETGDYFKRLEMFRDRSARKRVILFLGSNIGNFSDEQAIEFFRSLRRVTSKGDRVLIGFDLHKNPATILNAYDDSQGVTAKFNLNLLRRINRELGGNFDIEKFTHYASYHPLERAARSFLISLEEQTVTIGALNRSFLFRKWEPVFMEISQKYELAMIERLAAKSGFEIVNNYFDANRFYVDSLWKPAPDRLSRI